MTKRGEQFLPEQVDEQIEYIEYSTQQQQASQFIHDLRIASQDHTETFDRVWDRLLEHMEQTQVPSTAAQQHQQKRKYAMSQLQSAHQPKPRQRIMSWTTLVAAIILAILVTGSSVVVFQYAHSQQLHNTNVSGSVKSPSIKKSINTPVPLLAKTPVPLPANLCNLQGDSGWDAVCKTNQQTMIDQVHKLNGTNIHMYAGYADANRIILIYTIPLNNSVQNQIMPPTELALSAQKGVSISLHIGSRRFADQAKMQIYELASIPLLSVADNITVLHMHVDMSFYTNNMKSAGKTSFDFSLPFHRDHSTTASNQTQTVNG